MANTDPLHAPLPMPAQLAEPSPAEVAEVDALLWQAVMVADDAAVPIGQAVAELAASEGAPRWQVTGDREAEWAMRKVAEARLTLAELQVQRDDWSARIGQWFTQRAREPQAAVAFFTDHLERYALAERDRTRGRIKTVLLPSGKVTTRDAGPKVVVTDEQAVVEWADGLLASGDAEQVAPVVRKVYLQPLRQHVAVVPVADAATVLLASGELVEWRPELSTLPAPGDGWPSPDTATDLVARVDLTDWHLEVHGPDGQPVPGTAIDPGGVTATVTSEVP